MIEFEHVFGSRKKRQYGLGRNLTYIMKSAYEFDRKLFYYQVLPVIPAVAAAYLGTLIPAEVVSGLQSRWQVAELAVHISFLAFIMFLCNMISKGMLVYISRYGGTLSVFFSRKCFRKMMGLDYDLLEGAEEQKLIGNAWQAMRNSYNFVQACESIPQCAIAMIGVCFYGILIGRKSIVLVILMMISVIVSMKLLSLARKKHGEYHVRLSRYSKEAAYISRQSVESSAGKDIRIYRMTDWFLKKYDEALEHMDSIFAGIHNWYFLRSLSDALIGFLVDAFAWGYLIYLLANGKLTTAEFVFYLGLISGFGAYLEALIRRTMNFAPMSVSISYIREFLELKNHWGDAETKKYPIHKEEPLTIELKDVSYTYSGETKPALSHISLKINAGEKLALLGLNGAGKTTLVKLICGFYHPTQGEILVNGRPLTDYARDDYYKSISVLFQDVTLLPVTLDRTLTGQEPEEIDRERLQWALTMSGFLEKYESLPGKGECLLVREVNAKSVDFSGGEKQKALFARALYKKAGLLILDEPTAALDPIAENELYQSFSEAAEGRTSLYISHRLSSTRFCDRIVLLEHGCIVEEGTHESLLAGDTRYAQLFEIQSRYYKNREEETKRREAMGDFYAEDDTQKEGIFDE